MLKDLEARVLVMEKPEKISQVRLELTDFQKNHLEVVHSYKKCIYTINGFNNSIDKQELHCCNVKKKTKKYQNFKMASHLPPLRYGIDMLCNNSK